MSQLIEKKESIIADQIERDLGQFKHGILPSMKELCAQYDVSIMTLDKSLKILEQRRCIERKRGRRARIIGNRESDKSMAALQLADKLEAEIINGQFRAGYIIPKLDSLVIKYKVSRSSALQALEELENRNVCYKSGNKRIVGTKRSGVFTLKKNQQLPTIVVFTRTHSSYTHLFRSERTIDFMTEFNNELAKNGVRLMMVMWKNEKFMEVESEMGDVPISDLIVTLGSNYIGSAILSSSMSQLVISKIMKSTSRFKKPVIHLITSESNSNLSFPKYKMYFRCVFNEWAALKLALNTFENLGHQRICFPNLFEEYQSWAEERLRKAKIIIEKERLKIKIIDGTNLPIIGSRNRQAGEIDEWITRCGTFDSKLIPLLTTAYQRKKSILQKSGMYALALMTVLEKNHSFSAILAPNDDVAEGIYRWIQYKQKSIPEEISVLSFDNNYKSSHIPISTVDFGMKFTGYAAAQIFLKQVNIPLLSNKVIRPNCHIVHRGSLAPVKKSHDSR